MGLLVGGDGDGGGVREWSELEFNNEGTVLSGAGLGIRTVLEENKITLTTTTITNEAKHKTFAKVCPPYTWL